MNPRKTSTVQNIAFFPLPSGKLKLTCIKHKQLPLECGPAPIYLKSANSTRGMRNSSGTSFRKQRGDLRLRSAICAVHFHRSSALVPHHGAEGGMLLRDGVLHEPVCSGSM